MNVVFLDFNGVMDTYENMDEVDLENLSILKKLIKLLDAKVVISSSIKNTYYYSGRHNSVCLYLMEVLSLNGIEVCGITPKLENREDEIILYLKQHPEINYYYILEDDYLFPRLFQHQIKLPCQNDKGNGLKEIGFEKIKERLRKDGVIDETGRRCKK